MDGFALRIEPDPDDQEAAQIFVDGAIDGHPYQVLLDTGAARTSVIADTYTATFAAIEQRTSSGVFAASTNDLIVVPRIELGPIVKHDFPIARYAAGRPGVRNLIGMDLLKDSCCSFFFRKQWVAVGAVDESQVGVPFQDLVVDSTYHPYVDVQCAGATAHAVWDTGAGITIADLQFIEKYPELFEEVGVSQGTDATGAQMQTPMFRIARPMIGGIELLPFTVAGVDLAPVNATIATPMDMILGYNALIMADWIFDFPHQRWAVFT
jgi:hypothetical protein